MRAFAKVAALLFTGLLAVDANAHIEFVQARFLSLERLGDRWNLQLEIHKWENGGPVENPPRRVTVQFSRVPACIYHKNIYLGTPQEYAQAVELLRAQAADGKLHRFGLNATRVDEKGDRYISPNLRLGQMFDEPVVWAVARESSGERCPLKYVANR